MCGCVQFKLRWAANAKRDLSTINVKTIHSLRIPARKSHAGKKKSEDFRPVRGRRQNRVILSSLEPVSREEENKSNWPWVKNLTALFSPVRLKGQHGYLSGFGSVLVFESRSSHRGKNKKCLKVFNSIFDKKKIKNPQFLLLHRNTRTNTKSMTPLFESSFKRIRFICRLYWSGHIDWYLVGERWRDIVNLPCTGQKLTAEIQ